VELFPGTSIINEFAKSIMQDSQKTAEDREAAIDALDDLGVYNSIMKAAKNLMRFIISGCNVTPTATTTTCSFYLRISFCSVYSLINSKRVIGIYFFILKFW
jgi:hypothetical protein